MHFLRTSANLSNNVISLKLFRSIDLHDSPGVRLITVKIKTIIASEIERCLGPSYILENRAAKSFDFFVKYLSRIDRSRHISQTHGLFNANVCLANLFIFSHAFIFLWLTILVVGLKKMNSCEKINKFARQTFSRPNFLIFYLSSKLIFFSICFCYWRQSISEI